MSSPLPSGTVCKPPPSCRLALGTAPALRSRTSPSCLPAPSIARRWCEAANEPTQNGRRSWKQYPGLVLAGTKAAEEAILRRNARGSSSEKRSSQEKVHPLYFVLWFCIFCSLVVCFCQLCMFIEPYSCLYPYWSPHKMCLMYLLCNACWIIHLCYDFVGNIEKKEAWDPYSLGTSKTAAFMELTRYHIVISDPHQLTN